MSLQLHIDGTSRGNPGPTGVGIVLRDDDDRILEQTGRFLADLTDLEAAVQSLLIGLEVAAGADSTRGEMTIFSSSQWLVRQRLTAFIQTDQSILNPLDAWAEPCAVIRRRLGG